VNNLRGGDTESIYGRRVSVSSEQSGRDSHDGMRVFVKEHDRGGSKGSTSSFNLPQQGGQPEGRPQTQVALIFPFFEACELMI
jgi:serine/arginine repetitive matrix protein 2